VVAFIVPFAAISSIMAEALQGLHCFKSSVYILNISTSLWLIIFLIIFEFFGYSLDAILVCVALGISAFLTVAHGILLLKPWFFINDKAQYPNKNTILSSCIPLYVTDVMSFVVLWASQLMAVHWLQSDQLAHIAVAQRTAALTSLLLLAFNTITAPKFALFFSKGLFDDLKMLAQSSTLAITLVAIPVVLIMCFFPEWILSIFGSEFGPASALLPVLAIGQLINAATGSVGYLLTMSGHEKDMRNIAIISGVCAILLPFLLIPKFGALGAVFSTAIAMTVQNVMALFMVKRRLGFWTLSFLSFLK
jgi:O-antigen/teichoic acid export membrane protein